MEPLDAVVVGAGQAGLAASYYLCRDHREHIVIERGRIGETWLSQRWDSFKLNTTNIMNVLPGLPYDGPEPDGFWPRSALVEYFQRYAKRWELPVRTGVTVVSVRQGEDRKQFIVETAMDGRAKEPLLSRCVIVASGLLDVPRIPELASRLPARITQLHTATYRNPAVLPPGGVVVVGSGQSGVQIAEELLSAGRMVYLSTSKATRVPRRYRGREILDWWIDLGFLDVTYDSLEDKSISRLVQPQISGVGRYGHSLSLQHLARQGAVILGRLLDIEADTLVLGDEAAANVHFADEFSKRMKDRIDAYLEKAGMTPAPIEDDLADEPDPQAACVSPLRRLNLLDAKIGTVIWSTGFTGDLSWLHLPVLDADGKPVHQRGISPVAGLYFLGFPWLNSRKSGILYGAGEDARYVVDSIAKQLN
jgi:putative flavoprotein involved in K+ transport